MLLSQGLFIVSFSVDDSIVYISSLLGLLSGVLVLPSSEDGYRQFTLDIFEYSLFPLHYYLLACFLQLFFHFVPVALDR